jgi:hypothetical protein
VGGGFSVGVGVGADADDEVLDGVGAGALLEPEWVLLLEPPLPGVELAPDAPGD